MADMVDDATFFKLGYVPGEPGDAAKATVPKVPLSLKSLSAHSDSEEPENEFDRLADEVEDYLEEKSTDVADLPENSWKNRYKNIVPYDDTRVVLKQADYRGSDYVNANWIWGINSEGVATKDAFIATQGPLPHTIDDFWRMCWETQASVVIMLGKEFEKGVEKVARYWPLEKLEPDSGSDDDDDDCSGSSSGDDSGSEGDEEEEESYTKIKESDGVIEGHTMRVFWVSETEHESVPDLVCRKMRLHPINMPESAAREITQIQYTGWPDHGAPESTESIRKIVHDLHQHRSAGESHVAPVVVHCSAGIGRTGAFFTIQTHMERLRRLKERLDTEPDPETRKKLLEEFRIDVFWTVVQLRRCRVGMVQQFDQYAFCYRAILDEAVSLGLVSP